MKESSENLTKMITMDKNERIKISFVDLRIFQLKDLLNENKRTRFKRGAKARKNEWTDYVWL